MILLILLLSLMSIGLLGILIVVTYACVTTKTLHTFCSSLIKRKPTRIKYAADQDYAERVCESVEQNLEKIHQNLEDRDSVISLSAVSSEDDDDEARIEDHSARDSHCHYHPPGVACDCTDYEGSEVTLDSPASFDRRQRGVVVEVVKFNSPLVGIIV